MTAKAERLIRVFLILAGVYILAVLLLPFPTHSPINAKRKIAQAEEVELVAAINMYYAENSRFPISSNAIAAAGTNDFTFGTIRNTPVGRGRVSAVTIGTRGQDGYLNDNSEIMTILCDLNAWPELDHCYNKQKDVFFMARPADKSDPHGIGSDNVLRDPWGNPYIITLDLNGDNECCDSALDTMYRLEPGKGGSHLKVPGNVIVWSFGQNKSIDLTKPLNAPENKGIVASFQ